MLEVPFDGPDGYLLRIDKDSYFMLAPRYSTKVATAKQNALYRKIRDGHSTITKITVTKKVVV
jgi:hypothetical protein